MMKRHSLHIHRSLPDSSKIRQAGSIFFTLFAAVALVGAFAVGTTNVMKGIVTSMSEVTRKTVAEERMTGGARISIQAATAIQTGDGDCDGDGFVEPLPYRDALTAPHPAGGGYLPEDIGVNSKDPWGNELGYCVWDAGTKSVSDNDAACGGNTAKRLEGPKNANSATTVIAVISAGKDKRFSTTCNNFVDTTPADGNPDTPLIVKSGDDIVFQYTYDDANGLGGDDLWKIRDTQPDTAIIDKNIEVTGTGQFTGAINLMKSGLILPDDGTNTTCDATTDQQLRINVSSSPPALEICDFTGGNDWTAISMGAGEADPIPTAGLVGYWKMDEGTGTSVVDESPEGNDMTLYPSPNDPAWETAGKINGALYLNAAKKARMSVADDNSLDITSFTISAWVKAYEPQQYYYLTIAEKGNDSTNYTQKPNWILELTDSGRIICGYYDGSALRTYQTPVSSMSYNTWQHVACTFDNSTKLIKIYVNGAVVGSNTLTGTPATNSSKAVFGYSEDYDGYPYNGYLDEIAIYNRAIGDSEVTEIFDAGGGADTAITVVPTADGVGGGPGDFLGCALADGGPLVDAGDGPGSSDLAFWKQGSYLYSVNATNGTKAYSILNGVVTLLGSTSVANTTDVWSDGRYIYSTDSDSHLTVYTFNGTTFSQVAQTITSAPAQSVYGDGRYIYVGTNTGIEAYRFAGNTLTKLSTWLGGKTSNMWADRNYIYASDTWTTSGYLNILTFNGTSFTVVASDDYYYSVHFGDGKNIYIGGQSNISALTFDGTALSQKTTIGSSSGGTAIWGDGVNIFYGHTNGKLDIYRVQGGYISNYRSYTTGKGKITALYSDGTYLYVGYSAQPMDVFSGVTCDIKKTPSPSVLVAMDKYAGKIASGGFYGCGIKEDSTAWCWGTGNGGDSALGIGVTGVSKDTPTKINNPSGWKQIAAGSSTTCGIKLDGSLWCWGFEGTNQKIGNGPTSTSQLSPVSIDAGPWMTVSISDEHACGIKNDGTAWCWGNNSSGGLGTNNTTKYDVPTQVVDPGPWISISAGSFTSCGIKIDGSAWCWGSGAYKALGNGSTTNTSIPVIIAEPGPWAQIYATQYWSCGIKVNGSAWCWGQSLYGAMGTANEYQQDSLVPSRLQDPGPWLSLSMAKTFASTTCGIKYDGTAWCWGSGSNGQLGNNSTSSSYTSVQVADPGPWAALSVDSFAAYGIKTDGSLWSWGYDYDGALGNGPVLTANQLVPSRVVNWNNAPAWKWQDGGTEISVASSSNIKLQSGSAISYDGTSVGGAANGLLFNGSGRSILRQTNWNSDLTVETLASNAAAQMSWKAASAATTRSVGIDYLTGSLEFGANNGTMTSWMHAISPQMEIGLTGNVGIGTSGTPAYRLDVNGGIRIGNDAGTCVPPKAGTIRYVGGTAPYEFCNGSSWTAF